MTTGSSTGQTVTLNANTMYGKLRRRGLGHKAAMSLTRRALTRRRRLNYGYGGKSRISKAQPLRIYHWRHGWIPRDHLAEAIKRHKAHGSLKGVGRAATPERRGSSGLVTGDYHAARRNAEDLATTVGREVGLERAKEYGKTVYRPHILPNPENRYGHELRMEVVPPRPKKRLAKAAQPPADPAQLRVYRKLRKRGMSHEQAMALCKRANLAKAKYVPLHPPIIHHGKPNWVLRRGGLPGPIDAIARVLISHGWGEQRAVATAVSQAKKECATGRAAGGHIKLGGEAHATICAAVARWEAMKGSA